MGLMSSYLVLIVVWSNDAVSSRSIGLAMRCSGIIGLAHAAIHVVDVHIHTVAMTVTTRAAAIVLTTTTQAGMLCQPSPRMVCCCRHQLTHCYRGVCVYVCVCGCVCVSSQLTWTTHRPTTYVAALTMRMKTHGGSGKETTTTVALAVVVELTTTDIMHAAVNVHTWCCLCRRRCRHPGEFILTSPMRHHRNCHRHRCLWAYDSVAVVDITIDAHTYPHTHTPTHPYTPTHPHTYTRIHIHQRANSGGSGNTDDNDNTPTYTEWAGWAPINTTIWRRW